SGVFFVLSLYLFFVFFFQAEDGIRDATVTGVQTCALPIWSELKEPQKDLPFAMGAGVLIVTLLYLLANVAYLNVLPAAAIAAAPQDRVGTAALQAILGDPGLKLM